MKIHSHAWVGEVKFFIHMRTTGAIEMRGYWDVLSNG